MTENTFCDVLFRERVTHILFCFYLFQKEKNSVIMVNFYPGFVNCDPHRNATLQDVVGNWLIVIVGK